ncbi:hypothetical protein [Brevibacterium sp.]|uniref:hypothetical protein n=1 Tax=Brevibacterium sp. TaxID=1701 RepID=UPI0025B8DA07|nr:hypothetical protein [Brevibacterium sp.]
MESLWGLTGIEWTAVGAIAGSASLVTAVVIAVIVQRSATRTDAASRRITRSIEELVRRSRRDDLLQQLRADRDPEHIELLLKEARELSAGHPVERLGLEKAYFTNPAAPLLTYSHQLPSGMSDASKTALVGGVIEALPTRYRENQSAPSNIASDLAQLTWLSTDLSAPTYKIAQFLIERATTGWYVSDDMVRTILHPQPGLACPPNLGAAADYLHAIQHHPVSSATLVNTVAGVSLAIRDFHRLDSYGAPPANAYDAYIMLMQRKLVTIGRTPKDDEASIAVDHAISIMVEALGLIAGQDQHLNMRALEALNPILSSFDKTRVSSAGIVEDHLTNGVQRLLATNAPEHLRARLLEQTTRLVPRFRPDLIV